MKKKSVFLIVLFAVLLIGFLAFIIYKNYSNSKKDAYYNSTHHLKISLITILPMLRLLLQKMYLNKMYL